MAPTLEPTTMSTAIPCSTSARSMPTCTDPRLPPPANTSAVFGRVASGAAGFDGAAWGATTRSLSRGADVFRHGLVQDHAFERITVVLPRLSLNGAHRIGVTCLPALADAVRAEVDVLGMVLIAEPRREQLHDVHARQAAVLGE